MEPYAECQWFRTKIGSGKTTAALADYVILRSLMDDYRCTMVTIDQEPGESCGTRPNGHEPFVTLKKYRQNNPETHGPVARDNPNFAVYAALEGGILKFNINEKIANILYNRLGLPRMSIKLRWGKRRISAFSIRKSKFSIALLISDARY
jgi:hypothetical protein